jgi:hypothetical protein
MSFNNLEQLKLACMLCCQLVVTSDVVYGLSVAVLISISVAVVDCSLQ